MTFFHNREAYKKPDYLEVTSSGIKNKSNTIKGIFGLESFDYREEGSFWPCRRGIGHGVGVYRQSFDHK